MFKRLSHPTARVASLRTAASRSPHSVAFSIRPTATASWPEPCTREAWAACARRRVLRSSRSLRSCSGKQSSGPVRTDAEHQMSAGLKSN